MSIDTCPLCEKNNCDYRDMRVNNQEIADDKAYAELVYYQHKYKALEKRFSTWSKATRRVATYSLPVLVLTLGCLIFEKYFNITLPSFLSYFKGLKPFFPSTFSNQPDFIFMGLLFKSFSWVHTSMESEPINAGKYRAPD